MHDFLLENSIMYKELVQEGREQGIEIGLRQSIEAVVQTRFPVLLDLSREKAAHIQDIQKLREVLVAMSAATTERKARRYLLALREGE